MPSAPGYEYHHHPDWAKLQAGVMSWIIVCGPLVLRLAIGASSQMPKISLRAASESYVFGASLAHGGDSRAP